MISQDLDFQIFRVQIKRSSMALEFMVCKVFFSGEGEIVTTFMNALFGTESILDDILFPAISFEENLQ
mgnify:CR=1 FL=1